MRVILKQSFLPLESIEYFFGLPEMGWDMWGGDNWGVEGRGAGWGDG